MSRDTGTTPTDGRVDRDAPIGTDSGEGLCLGVDCTALDDACHVGTCDPSDGVCDAIPRADGASCDDGSECTSGDVCTAGECRGGPFDCGAMSDDCNTAACDPATGTCVRTPVADGATCDDGSACTTGETCMAGVCTGSGPDCSALTTGCTRGACNPTTGMCEATMAADGTSCDDTLACTMGDVCMGGMCAGTMLPQCNATCSLATVVSDGSMVPSQNTTFGVDNLTFAGCGDAVNHVLYYTATIPPGQRLSASVMPLSLWDPAIRVLPACGATTCVAHANSGFDGDPDGVVYSNGTGTAQVVIIAIGSADTTFGSFDLAVRIGPAPYVETVIPTACDVMPPATIVPTVIDDDETSPTAALPFTFRIITDAMTHYSISTNGNVQLFASATGLGNSEYVNESIPSAISPNGLVAPFWDDLVVDTLMGADVRAQTLGTAPNRHFTVQWTNVSFYADGEPRLTFQAKIFETTNVIEFHYCSMVSAAGSTLITGQSATVGVENAAGADGHQHSFDTLGSVSPANAIRLTPFP